jgi:peptidoglycan/xylan/chitin deacetylase (PgdA/CDA1 family)
MRPLKEGIARVFDGAGLNGLLLAFQARCLRPHIRAVNYHDVPPALAPAFEEQLRFYRRHFEPVGLQQLRAFREGDWSSDRPGLILSFDDGLRSHADVVAPLLERYGFPGWFMVPVGFVEAAPAEQAGFAKAHSIQCEGRVYEDGRIAMSWHDLRRLDGRHVIACHTRTHRRLSASLSDEEVQDEIAGSKQALEAGLGHPIEVFAWVGGEEESYSAKAARAINDAGFSVSFMTNSALIRPHTEPLQLQRSNIEAGFTASLMRFTLSGCYDIRYLLKRRRVNRLTSLAPARPR